MIFVMVLLCAVSALALPAPEESFDVIQEIFGNSVGEGYGSESVDEKNLEAEVLNMIQEMTSYNPFNEANSTDENIDQAIVAVDTAFENCEEYSGFGFECVPYYQCHNGSIITDGKGLIDIRNGFGTLDPVASKCPGLLDVCCKDPEFIELPPQEPEYTPRCGKHNVGGYNVKIEGFKDSESQFGEWPHMCAVMHTEQSEESAQPTNVYECGVGNGILKMKLNLFHIKTDFLVI
jgi:hypothetical protein